MKLEACLVCSCGELRSKEDPPMSPTSFPRIPPGYLTSRPDWGKARSCRSCGVVYCFPNLPQETLAQLDPATRERIDQ